jgi:hypothetical protein
VPSTTAGCRSSATSEQVVDARRLDVGHHTSGRSG